MDGAIGGLLGVIGWPLAPFLACYSVFQVLFKDGPSEPNPIDPAIKDAARKSIGLNCEQFYNVAVVGSSGTGKSSIVNGIMGYKDSYKDAAPTGESETTKKPRAYRHPDLRSMVIWDMPGAGTMNHPASTYFEDKFLCAFDSLVIVTAERLMSIDVKIAQQAQQFNIPVLVVRNKADQALEAKIRKMREQRSPASVPSDLADVHQLRIQEGGSNDSNATKVSAAYEQSDEYQRLWNEAVGQLGKEVRKTVYRDMKNYKISTRRLFTISAWNLQEFVQSLSQQDLRRDYLRLIDENRFLKVLIEGVLLKRKREMKKKQQHDD
ncbi:P-loop containing nucleoside triphosphate hydrolase protein [Hesseltinella vesiculosa]|uniref:P-loop containing nucleoside triphosphate hydrolase protein n=1 Tax=Hesseltinella vesiculosa TaxID=101127 RepID=A0A1X2GXK6_9FUNG|nr:P-loop containing nucleoside triphosphate hydrolase protein [Hesseltinella vesiculosa]